MLIRASTTSGCFCMFDLAEIQDRIKKHEKMLDGIENKMSELKNEFEDLTSQCQAHDDDYFREHHEEREQLAETIRKRLSVYELLKEVADDIRTKTFEDMQNVYEELQKTKYFE